MNLAKQLTDAPQPVRAVHSTNDLLLNGEEWLLDSQGRVRYCFMNGKQICQILYMSDYRKDKKNVHQTA